MDCEVPCESARNYHVPGGHECGSAVRYGQAEYRVLSDDGPDVDEGGRVPTVQVRDHYRLVPGVNPVQLTEIEEYQGVTHFSLWCFPNLTSGKLYLTKAPPSGV